MDWYVYRLPQAGGTMWGASNVFRDEWTAKQEMLYVEAVLAAKAKGWNGVEYGMPQYGEEQGMHGKVYAVFGTKTDRMEQIIMFQMAFNGLTQFLLP